MFPSTSRDVTMRIMESILHRDEININDALARRLIDEQFPQYRKLFLKPLGASGSSNRLYRLGEDLLVRLPRQPGAGESITKEHRWLPFLRDKLPAQIPEIVCLAEPDPEFSEHWAITKWLTGDLATASAAGLNSTQLASQLADFILALRHIGMPAEAQTDPRLRWYRGEALANYDPLFQRTLKYCRQLDGLNINYSAANAIWQEAMNDASSHETQPDSWFHSDLVAENLLLENGGLIAVLDFGSVSIGDPTIDLHGAWELFDDDGRDLFRKKLGASDQDWMRGRAWALAIGLGALAYYWRTMPKRVADRLVMVNAVLKDGAKSV